MTCQSQGCTRQGELACTVGDRRQVLCIEHQARHRQAMSCGGRTITVHHGVALEDWSIPEPRRAPPDNDIPNLGMPHSAPPPPPTPPPTLRVHMAHSVTPCFWPECKRERLQGVGCKYHNDLLRRMYGTASKLSRAKLDAAPAAWEARELAKKTALVPVSEYAAPAVKGQTVPVTDGPNVKLAQMLIEASIQLTDDETLRAILIAAAAVLQ